MIGNTLLIWSVTALLLAASGWVGVLVTRKIVALVLVPMQVGHLLVPAAAAVCGVLSAVGITDLFLSMAVSAAVGIAFFAWATDRLSAIGKLEIILSLIPAGFTWAGYGFTRAISYAHQNYYPVLYGILIAAVILICLVSVYLFAAFSSTGLFPLLPERWFFYYPQNSRTDVAFSTDEEGRRILMDKEERPYTGMMISYKKKLRPVIGGLKEGGIAYYVEGRYFGSSGNYVEAGGAQHQVSLTAEDEMKETYLLHVDYPKLIEQEVSSWGDFCYSEERREGSGDDGRASYTGIARFEKDGIQVKKLIHFYENGMVKDILTLRRRQKRWEYDAEDNLMFDSLGYCKEKNERWSKDSFIPSDFNAKILLGRC